MTDDNVKVIMYRDDPDLQAVIDWIQIYFKCCGPRSPHDWEKNLYFNKTSQIFSSPEAGGVPYSCCKQPRTIDEGPINYYCGHGARLRSEVNDFFVFGFCFQYEIFSLRKLCMLVFTVDF